MNIKLLRVRRMLSQEALAERSGVGRDTISRIENGHTQNVQYRPVARLAKALEVNPIELLDG